MHGPDIVQLLRAGPTTELGAYRYIKDEDGGDAGVALCGTHTLYCFFAASFASSLLWSVLLTLGLILIVTTGWYRLISGPDVEQKKQRQTYPAFNKLRYNTHTMPIPL